MMLTLIVNPTAGNGYAQKVAEQLRTELEKRGVPHRFCYTERPGHATELAQQAAAQEDCTAVLSVGGDGTAYEVACGLMNTGKHDSCRHRKRFQQNNENAQGSAGGSYVYSGAYGEAN